MPLFIGTLRSRDTDVSLHTPTLCILEPIIRVSKVWAGWNGQTQQGYSAVGGCSGGTCRFTSLVLGGGAGRVREKEGRKEGGKERGPDVGEDLLSMTI